MKRFWSKVDKRGPDECWPWTSNQSKRGYGYFKLRGKNVLAHRVMYHNEVAKISKKDVIRHLCDNPNCVNPKHLKAGTQKDNMKDRKDAGNYKGLKGEDNPAARLTPLDVRNIRRDYKKGMPQIALGWKYGVSQTHISDILNRKSWGHLK